VPNLAMQFANFISSPEWYAQRKKLMGIITLSDI
jgi:hypothetical protein